MMAHGLQYSCEIPNENLTFPALWCCQGSQTELLALPVHVVPELVSYAQAEGVLKVINRPRTK